LFERRFLKSHNIKILIEEYLVSEIPEGEALSGLLPILEILVSLASIERLTPSCAADSVSNADFVVVLGGDGLFV
jgi:hypothetical protein